MHQQLGETSTDANAVAEAGQGPLEGEHRDGASPSTTVCSRFPAVSSGAYSPALAAAYAHKTERTLMRDLNSLERMGLIWRSDEGWWPNSDSVLGFMPSQARARGGDVFLSW